MTERWLAALVAGCLPPSRRPGGSSSRPPRSRRARSCRGPCAARARSDIAHAALRRGAPIRSPEAFVALSAVRGSFRGLKRRRVRAPAGRLDPRRPRHDRERARSGSTRCCIPRAHDRRARAALESARLARPRTSCASAADPAFLRAHGIDAARPGGLPVPRHLPVRPRHDGRRRCSARMVQRMRSKLTPEHRDARAGARALTIARAPDPGVDHRARGGRRRRAPAHRGRLLEPAAPEHPAAGRPHGAVRRGQGAAHADARGSPDRSPVQHVPSRSGLPPGPIASPGLASIEAALDPAPVPYLFFVAMDDQRHTFSVTLEDHNAAVARYRSLARPR